MGGGTSRITWLVGCVASVIAFEIGASLTSSRHVWADASWLAVDVFALAQCVMTARKSRPPVRIAWWCFTIAIGVWTVGMSIWAYYELGRHQLTPFPSLVDLCGWLGAPFFVAGIFFYKTRDRSRMLGLKQLADLALSAASIVAGASAVLYAPVVTAPYSATYVGSALTTAVLSVVTLMFGLIMLWQHLDGPRRRVLAILLGGEALLALVSVLYAEALLAGRYYAGTWIDVLWVIAFLAFATAAREERHLPDEEASAPVRSVRLDPIVPSSALVLWMAASLATHGAFALLVINAATGAVLAVSIFVRIWTTQRIERALAARIAQEEARAWQLEARLERAQKLEAVGTLAGGVAHDFNNVLAAATGGLKMARRKLLRGESVTNDLDEIDAVLWRAADLTSRLLDLARKRDPKPVVIDPRDAMERARVLLAKVLPSDVRIETELAAGPPISVDPSGLEHALLNLGLNARDALGERGGVVTLRAATGAVAGLEGTAVILEVHDDGPGVPADALPRVFEPFFTTKADGGTGLGLAMVEAFATANGGLISVTSRPGSTAFRLAFPAARATAEIATSPAPTATVLVVSREDALGLATAGALERGGIAAFVARDTTMALAEYARLPRVDAVLVDATVGRDTLRALRDAGLSASSILLAAPGGDDDIGDWSAVVRKPYDPHALVTEVHRVIAAAEPPR